MIARTPSLWPHAPIYLGVMVVAKLLAHRKLACVSSASGIATTRRANRASCPNHREHARHVMANRLTIVGCGTMGEAILGGLLREKIFGPGDVIAAARRSEPAERLRSTYGIEVSHDNVAACAAAEVILVALKPRPSSSCSTIVKEAADGPGSQLSRLVVHYRAYLAIMVSS